jgi:hypothetical protein
MTMLKLRRADTRYHEICLAKKEDQDVEARSTDEQIVRALHQAEGGTKISDIGREHGISEATILPRAPGSRWIAAYWSMSISKPASRAFSPPATSLAGPIR